MASLPGWMPILLDRIQWGCSTSPWFVNLADETLIEQTGKSICLDLWPFIRELPTNIAFVRDAVPEHMTAAKNLLGQLSDDERHYQQLFVKQCHFAGVSAEEMSSNQPTPEAAEFCDAMRAMCRESSFADGIYAIVAAEFAATLYSRAALPSWENYFSKRPNLYPREQLDEGLEWIRLHAKTHTRHAIWMKRMLGDIQDSSGDDIPAAAELLLACVLKLWHCPAEESRSPATAST